MKTYNTRISGEIKQYDLVLVSTDSFLDIGFYYGRGPTGTFQYYNLWSFKYVYQTRDPETGLLTLKPHKSYINSPTEARITKYSPDLLEGDHKENYYIALEVFKLLNIEL